MLAYYIPYGNEENTVDYSKEQLKDPNIVKNLFDLCQILEGYITYEGWLFLIAYHGYESLFDIDSESGWFDCANLDSFKKEIVYQRDLAKITAIDECGNIW
ncbi:MAG: hypothetical protein Q4E53_05585 [Eubacteriales bacterium]|nr:hypothetical protein [Eubacteriales bacterium]